MEISYKLTALVDGFEVYAQTAESIEVLELSLFAASNAVDQELLCLTT